MSEFLKAFLEHDLLKHAAEAVATVSLGVYTVYKGWNKSVKPWITEKVKGTANEEQVRRIEGDVNKLKDEIGDVKETQAKTDGKIDTIVQYTKDKS